MRLNRQLKFVLYDSADTKVVWKPFGYHKLLLGVFGLFFDGMRGFWIGFVIGSMFDAEVITKENQSSKTKHDWRVSYLMLGAFVLQVPGVGSKLSGSAIRQALVRQFGETYTQKRLPFFYELLRQRIQVEKICDHMRTDATALEKNTLLRFLFELAEQPGVETHNLHHSINYVAARIEVSFETLQQIYRDFLQAHQRTRENTRNPNDQNGRPHTPSAAEKWFATLGLTEKASEKEVKKAYYTLAKKYHPDSNPNASPQQKKNLESQLRIVIEAYEEICALRGW